MVETGEQLWNDSNPLAGRGSGKAHLVTRIGCKLMYQIMYLKDFVELKGVGDGKV